MQYNPKISHVSQLFQARDVLGILKENSVVMQLNSCQYPASQTGLAPGPKENPLSCQVKRAQMHNP